MTGERDIAERLLEDESVLETAAEVVRLSGVIPDAAEAEHRGDIVYRMRNIKQYDPCVHSSWCKEAARSIESLRAVMWKDHDEIKRLRITLQRIVNYADGGVATKIWTWDELIADARAALKIGKHR